MDCSSDWNWPSGRTPQAPGATWTATPTSGPAAVPARSMGVWTASTQQPSGPRRRTGIALPWLRFAPAGQTLFDAWRADLERRILGDSLHPALESHLTQCRSLVPSLALLCHLADSPDGGPVGRASVLRALAWSAYLESHAQRINALALVPDLA
jgi:hypothetical protein